MFYLKNNLKILLILSFLLINTNYAYSKDLSFKGGVFSLTSVPELASEFYLKDDGTFEYYLSYGAYDEFSKGTWTQKEGVIILKSNIPDTPPKFSLKALTNTKEENYTILVQNKKGEGLAGIDVVLYFKKDRIVTGYTQYYGFRFSPEELPEKIGLKIDMYGVKEQIFDVKEQKGSYFIFEFDAGNMGLKSFNNVEMIIKDNNLIMVKDGSEIKYIRQK